MGDTEKTKLRLNGRSFRRTPNMATAIEALCVEITGEDLEKIPGGAKKFLLVPWPEATNAILALDAEKERLRVIFGDLPPFDASAPPTLKAET